MTMSRIEQLAAIIAPSVVPILYAIDRLDIISLRRRGNRTFLVLSLAVILTWILTAQFQWSRVILAAAVAILAQTTIYTLMEELFLATRKRFPNPVYGRASDDVELVDRVFGFLFLVVSIAVGCMVVIVIT